MCRSRSRITLVPNGVDALLGATYGRYDMSVADAGAFAPHFGLPQALAAVVLESLRER